MKSLLVVAAEVDAAVEVGAADVEVAVVPRAAVEVIHLHRAAHIVPAGVPDQAQAAASPLPLDHREVALPPRKAAPGPAAAQLAKGPVPVSGPERVSGLVPGAVPPIARPEAVRRLDN